MIVLFLIRFWFESSVLLGYDVASWRNWIQLFHDMASCPIRMKTSGTPLRNLGWFFIYHFYDTGLFFLVGNYVSLVVIYIWLTWFNNLFQKVLQWYFEEYRTIFFLYSFDAEVREVTGCIDSQGGFCSCKECRYHYRIQRVWRLFCLVVIVY